MSDQERRFFLYLWRALGAQPFVGNAAVFHEVREKLGIDHLVAHELVDGWELAGWWGQEEGKPFVLRSWGHFTLAGAKEVAFQAALYVKGYQAQPPA